MLGPRRALAVLLGAVLFVAALALALLRLVVPRPPDLEVAETTPFGPPLTKQLVVVIVDGLRYDLANDPAWMPLLAARMRAATHGEIWSGPVSMTSSAILTYATGQRGDLDQIVNNETGSPVTYDHLIGNAREAGLSTAFTGDRAWYRMFPGAWNLSHPDPYGVAIDVDYNAEIFQAAYSFLAAKPRPSLMVAHFVTPDHQAHAYGIFSDRYRAHLAGFDRELHTLLRSLETDATVIVTSDHGATDTGTHGSDTPLQRRSPILAYGPGVVTGRAESERLEQIDLPTTFATLLGIAPPAQSRGHALVDWLDVPDERRAEIACADVARLGRYAERRLDREALRDSGLDQACARERAPRERIDAARRAARALDAALDRAAGPGFALAWMAPALALLGAAVLAWAALGRAILSRASLLLGALLAISLSATWGIELLPGRWPSVALGLGYLLGNGALAWALARPQVSAAWLDAHPALGAALVPGLLAVTPTKTTQVESLLLSLVVAFFALTAPVSASQSTPLWPRRFRLAPWRGVLAIALLAAMAPIGILNQGFAPTFLASGEVARLSVALSSLALLALARQREESTRGHAPEGSAALATVGVAVALGSLILRTRAPAPLCIAIWLASPLAAGLAWRRGHRVLAELLAVASYAQVARDDELPVLIATYLVARAVGAGLAASQPRDRVRPSPTSVGAAPRHPPAQCSVSQSFAPRASLVIAAVTFGFAWSFIQRIGIQRGIDFVQLDWGAGAFRESGVGMWRIGAAISYKHCFARAAVLFAVLSALPGEARLWTARGVFATETVRVAALATALYVCRDSFWTALRAIGDVPHALAAVVVSAGALLVVVARARAPA